MTPLRRVRNVASVCNFFQERSLLKQRWMHLAASTFVTLAALYEFSYLELTMSGELFICELLECRLADRPSCTGF